MRISIIGNCGSGKTWLANKLSKSLSAPVIFLDDIFWEPGGFNKKRADSEVNQLIESGKSSDSWIVEGVFGDLIERFLDDADLLVWLDIDWVTCKRRLHNRGSESAKFLGRTQSDQQFNDLIDWGREYYERDDLRSYTGHQAIFNQFNGGSKLLQSEQDVDLFLESITKNNIIET